MNTLCCQGAASKSEFHLGGWLVFLRNSLCTLFQLQVSTKVLVLCYDILGMQNRIKTYWVQRPQTWHVETCSSWEGLGGVHGFVTLLTHSRKVQSCLCPSATHLPLHCPSLHLERQNFALRGGCKRYYSALTSWLQPYQIIMFLWDQKVCFILSCAI